MKTATKRPRVLMVRRLSHDIVRSVSVDMQRDRIEAWCASQGMNVVGDANDVDVSGAISPFKRDGLGPWLTDNPPKPYDFIVAYQLSRISRSALDTMNLVRWLGERGRNLATVDDGLNTSTTFGKTVIYIIAALAEAELEVTRIRLLDNKDVKRKLGFIVQGTGGWGYKLQEVKIDGVVGKRVVQNPDTAPFALEAAERATKGEPILRICKDFTRRGVALPSDDWDRKRGEEWHSSTLKRVLRNWSMCGYQIHGHMENGKRVVEIVRDDNGNPVMVTDEPLMTRVEFDKLQRALDELSNPHAQPRKGSTLSGVATCTVCQRPRVTGNSAAHRTLLCRTMLCAKCELPQSKVVVGGKTLARCTTKRCKGKDAFRCPGGSLFERFVWEVLDERLHAFYPNDVPLSSIEPTESTGAHDERIEALEAKEIELKETLRLNALDRGKWDADGLSDVYASIQAESRARLTATRDELEALRNVDDEVFVQVDMGTTLFEAFDALRAQQPAKVDMQFILDFTYLGVEIGPALPQGQDPRGRINIDVYGDPADSQDLDWDRVPEDAQREMIERRKRAKEMI